MPTHRITNGMRSAAQFVRLQVPKNRSRAMPFMRFCLHHIWGRGHLLTQSPIACPKRRIPTTLSAICPKIKLSIDNE